MTADPHAAPPDRAPGANPAAVPAALSAFLRGIERRGAVLAELQCGDPVAGDAALAAAMRAFRTVGPGEPMARWPLRFWALLLATPQLRRPFPGARGDEDALWLTQLTPGPRAAILLRLAAGLDEGDAAHALAIARPVYRRALRRALPRREDGRADPAAWLRLRAHVHRRIKTLPNDRLSVLARLREDALTGRHFVPPAAVPPAHPRWVGTALRAGVAACAFLFVASFFPWWRLGGELRKEALPIEAPAARFDEQTALLTHRDFALLADPEGAALAEDLAFLSWLSTQPEVGDPEEDTDGTVSASGLASSAVVAARDAPTDVGVLVETRRQAWEQMTEAERAQFQQRLDAWDALPHAEAGAQRERYVALQALDGVDLALLRQTRSRLQALTAVTRDDLRDRFGELSVTEQRGWLLGPRVGADMAALSPLLLQVPEEQRVPLLDMLRVMTPEERADLAVLAYRTPPQERNALRLALLETTDDNRSAWLRLRLSQ
ncbi:MAG TPA: DUF3106 domain-containing protein [Xanthomonadaceae bacterium]|nr:DUF3106 domain-containing protein [Xanthomonadaceae bacterium]